MEKINLESVKIALERDEMLEIAGGSFWRCAGGIVGGAMLGAAGASGNGIAFFLGPVGVAWGTIGGIGGGITGAATFC
jgi:hypothetical protein